MKKIISILLTVTLFFGLCACGEKADSDLYFPEQTQNPIELLTSSSNTLQIGFSKVDITPDFKVGLSGYSDATTRKNTSADATNIYATCIAATSGDETILIFTVDTVQIRAERAEKFRSAIKNATGIDGTKMFFGATHGHNCPDYDNTEYHTFLLAKLKVAAKEALADRCPAKIQSYTGKIEKMNSVRHYLMKDGTYAGSNFGSFSSGVVAQAAVADSSMVLVKFDRGTEKRDVLMVNWQAHPDRAKEIGYNAISASWIGPFRDKLAEDTGMLVAYFTGASGNVNDTGKVKGDTIDVKWQEYGTKLAEAALPLLDNLKAVSGTAINTKRVQYKATVDHSLDGMLSQAQEVWNMWNAGNKDAANAKAKTYGWTSAYQARAIIQRQGRGEYELMELNAFSIGGVGFVTCTYEMFASASLYIKENSPFENTFILCGCNGYIPDEAAFNYRCYEADTGMYVKGISEGLATEMVNMLKSFQ